MRKIKEDVGFYVSLSLSLSFLLSFSSFFASPEQRKKRSEARRGPSNQHPSRLSSTYIRLSQKFRSFCWLLGSDENLGFVAFDFCFCFCGFLALVKMMVANSFDLWKKDVFFPAAEEVQESADMYVPFCFHWF